MPTFIYGSQIIAKNNNTQNPTSTTFTGTSSPTIYALTGGIETSVSNAAFASDNSTSFNASLSTSQCECQNNQIWSHVQSSCIDNPCDEHHLYNSYTDECDCDSSTFNCTDPNPNFDPDSCACVGATPTPTPTKTRTPTPTSTATSTPTSTPTSTSTPTGTPNPTPTPSSSYSTPSGQWYKELP